MEIDQRVSLSTAIARARRSASIALPSTGTQDPAAIGNGLQMLCYNITH